jgi:DNA-binding FadR family transcriptional regulator
VSFDVQPSQRAGASADRPRTSRPRLASIVVKDLAKQIISGNLPTGETLPTEGALGDQYGFSRTVLREALKLLEERGLVRVEQGRGTTVQPRTLWNLLDPEILEIALAYDHDRTLLNDLISTRRLLEADMARVAAQRLTDEELDSLGEIVRLMAEAHDDFARFSALDRRFHVAVMRASNSEIGRAIVTTIHEYASPSLHLNEPEPSLSTGRDPTIFEHEAILEALYARDGELAARRMAEHIDSAWIQRRGSRFATR